MPDAAAPVHEAALIDAFVVARSQDRWRLLIGSKRRHELLERLASQ